MATRSSSGARTLRMWARNAREVARNPIDDPTKQAIAGHLETAASERMDRGVAPDGTPFPPLSPSYVKRKGHSKFWRLSGDSGVALRSWVTDRGVRQVINTPYSGYVHDGVTYTRRYRARTSSSIATHQRQLAAGSRRKRAHNQRLKQIYGFKTAKANRRAHALALREARNARRRGAAELLPQYRRSRQKQERRTSWTVRIPARPVLGVSTADAAVIKRLMAAAAAARLRGEGR